MIDGIIPTAAGVVNRAKTFTPLLRDFNARDTAGGFRINVIEQKLDRPAAARTGSVFDRIFDQGGWICRVDSD
jgi:hypothetical protein